MPVFPGDEVPVLTAHTEKEITHYKLLSGMHIGTHMDAPLHMIVNGKKISDFETEKFIGPGVLIDARGKNLAGEELLKNKKINPGDIVLVLFGQGEKFRESGYFANYPELSLEFANYLCERGVKMVGTDTPSPDREPYEVHKQLLKNDILILENLTNLERLIGREFKIFALPLCLDAEASLARVVAEVV